MATSTNSCTIPIGREEQEDNILQWYGLQRGIQFSHNSCYIDSTLMHLFYVHRHTDKYLANNDDIIYTKLNVIVEQLRSNNHYCPATEVEHLRILLWEKGIFTDKIRGGFVDAAEFMQKLFPIIFTSGFFAYRPNGKDFIHQIVNYNYFGVQKGAVCLQNLFDTSMTRQRLHFLNFPNPLLIIKLPVSGGRLVGSSYVIPDLRLRVKAKEPNEGTMNYDLTGVMSLQACHFTSYIRKEVEGGGFTWMYYNSTSHNALSMVVPCPDLERSLEEIMKSGEERDRNDKFDSLVQTDLILADLCKTAFIAFYAPSAIRDGTANAGENHTGFPTGKQGRDNGTNHEYCVSVHVPTSVNAHSEESQMTLGKTVPVGTSASKNNVFSLVVRTFIDTSSPLRHARRPCSVGVGCACIWHCIQKMATAYSQSANKSVSEAEVTELEDRLCRGGGVTQDQLYDPFKAWIAMLHCCGFPALYTTSSESARLDNVYQLDLSPSMYDKDVKTLGEEVKGSWYIIEPSLTINSACIIARAKSCKSWIVPTQEIQLMNATLSLYAVLCKSSDVDFSLYALEQVYSGQGQQQWTKWSHSKYERGERVQTKQTIKTSNISKWESTQEGQEEVDIMRCSVVWLYKATTRGNRW